MLIVEAYGRSAFAAQSSRIARASGIGERWHERSRGMVDTMESKDEQAALDSLKAALS